MTHSPHMRRLEGRAAVHPLGGRGDHVLLADRAHALEGGCRFCRCHRHIPTQNRQLHTPLYRAKPMCTAGRALKGVHSGE